MCAAGAGLAGFTSPTVSVHGSLGVLGTFGAALTAVHHGGSVLGAFTGLLFGSLTHFMGFHLFYFLLYRGALFGGACHGEEGAFGPLGIGQLSDGVFRQGP
jgi:hypothetical protein